MLTIAAEVFDAIITGTTTTWYTADQFDSGIGNADYYTVQAVTTGVSGTSPTLTVIAQQSADDQRWSDVGTIISTGAMSSGAALTGSVNFGSQKLGFGRLKITMGGATTPACRLSVYVTGRTKANGVIFNEPVFDETIAGTTQTWKSSASKNDLLGIADSIYVAAVAENVTGTVNLVVTGEHSADGQNWKSFGSVINENVIASGTPYIGTFGSNPVLLHYARLSVQMTGTTPQCRLKLFATGRTY